MTPTIPVNPWPEVVIILAVLAFAGFFLYTIKNLK